MRNKNYEGAYLKAMNKVDRLRGFYWHLIVYLIVNTGITVLKITRNIGNGESFNEAFFDLGTFIVWLFWGIGLALHAFSVFGLPYLLGKNWEENKIKEFMEEETKNELNKF